jgi:hypothetical protein
VQGVGFCIYTYMPREEKVVARRPKTFSSLGTWTCVPRKASLPFYTPFALEAVFSLSLAVSFLSLWLSVISLSLSSSLSFSLFISLSLALSPVSLALAHIRQSQPESGSGLQVKVPKTCQVVPASLRSGGSHNCEAALRNARI